MFAKLYNSYRNWKTETDETSQIQIESISLLVNKEAPIKETISFLSCARFDTVNISKNSLIQNSLVSFLYENQMALSFSETPLLKEMMNGYNPLYAHSSTFFDERIHHLWFEYTLTYLKNNTEETRHILTSLLEIYSDWDGEYHYPVSYNNKIFRNIYRFCLTEEHGVFKNKLGNSCKIEDVITGILYYQEKGIGYGLYRSSFYNVLLFLVLRNLSLEIQSQLIH
jgi:hypothetical protein